MVEAKVSPRRPRRRGLILIWIILVALVGVIISFELAKRAEKPSGENIAGSVDSRLLLPVPVADLGVIELAISGTLHRFERDYTGAWFYHGIHSAAQQGHAHAVDLEMAKKIDYAFAALGRARMERQFKLDLQAGDYGVSSPRIIILVYRKGDTQPLAQYAVGDIAPDTFSRYVLRVGGSTVVTIANYQIDNLTSLIQTVSQPVSPLLPPALNTK
jgi:hypothetical protein